MGGFVGGLIEDVVKTPVNAIKAVVGGGGGGSAPAPQSSGISQAEFDKLQSQFDKLQGQYDTLQGNYSTVSQDLTGLRGNYDTLTNQYTGIKDQYAGLQDTYSGLMDQFSGLEDKYGTLQGTYGNLQDQYGTLQNQFGTIQDQNIQLQGMYDTASRQALDAQNREALGIATDYGINPMSGPTVAPTPYNANFGTPVSYATAVGGQPMGTATAGPASDYLYRALLQQTQQAPEEAPLDPMGFAQPTMNRG